ncbi:tetratricopeptide repeat protein [Ekhidna sp. To15]|uniref:tetratricopeptide repeat protein n=1 Tax=Ekhidna sp. To15 TaxID=3395267 RepID=UPI003F51EA1B
MKQKKEPNQRFNPWKIVILLALLGSISWVIWTLAKPSTPDELYAEYFEPYIIQTTPRGLIEDTDLYMLGTIHYRDMAYDSAISKFETQLEETPDDYRSQLMLSISYMAIKDFTAAEDVLLQLVNDPNHLFQDQARWYLGLLYLTDEDEANDDKAAGHFEEIEDKALLKQISDI